MPLLLAVDTSGKNGSLALARVKHGQNGQNEIEMVEVVPLVGGTFSAQLVPQISVVLQKYHYSKSDLEAFAVASGPGSFTGLRVGLAAIKALGEVLQKPIAAVSLLEAVAWIFRSRGAGCARALVLLDAGRGDVYAGDYELNPQIKMCSERLLNREELLKEVSATEATGTNVVTPDRVFADMVPAAGHDSPIRVELVEYPDSAVVARVGWEHLQRGETVRPEGLEANYLRHSDAEIFSKPKP